MEECPECGSEKIEAYLDGSYECLSCGFTQEYLEFEDEDYMPE